MSMIFVAGSISIKQLDPKVKARIDSIVEGDHTVIVGDADGADSSVQSYLCGKVWRRPSSTAVGTHLETTQAAGRWFVSTSSTQRPAPAPSLLRRMSRWQRRLTSA
ncbi:hypothetical protein D9M72_208060 [compost metagenome]